MYLIKKQMAVSSIPIVALGLFSWGSSNGTPKAATKAAGRIAQVLFGNNFRNSDGIFNQRQIFLVDAASLEDIQKALDAEIRRNYQKHNKPDPDVKIHKTTINLTANDQTMSDSLHSFFGAADILDGNIFVITLEGDATANDLEKLVYFFRSGGERSLNANKGRVILLTANENLFNVIGNLETKIAVPNDMRKRKFCGIF